MVTVGQKLIVNFTHPPLPVTMVGVWRYLVNDCNHSKKRRKYVIINFYMVLYNLGFRKKKKEFLKLFKKIVVNEKRYFLRFLGMVTVVH